MIFTNDVTFEYKWFDITFKIVECGPLEVISLKCGVRQTCHHEIKLVNPTENKIQYELEATSPEISFENSVFDLEPEETVSNIYFFDQVKFLTKNISHFCTVAGLYQNFLHANSRRRKNGAINCEVPDIGSFSERTSTDWFRSAARTKENVQYAVRIGSNPVNND